MYFHNISDSYCSNDLKNSLFLYFFNFSIKEIGNLSFKPDTNKKSKIFSFSDV